jgi:hypothetical protein
MTVPPSARPASLSCQLRTLFTACLFLVLPSISGATPLPMLAMSASAAARLTINSGAGTLNSSSSNTTGSFQLVNLSAGGQRITSFKIDLRTALLPDLVFDPFGTAGDVDGKAFGLDFFDGSGTPLHAFESPHDGIGSEDGYDVLRVDFGPGVDFAPGDLLKFSSDIDPTSIKGAIGPGPNHSGSISGLELAGSTVTVTFDDATVRVVRMGGWNFGNHRNKTSVGVLAADNLPTPGLSVPGKSSPFTTSTRPVVRVTGPAGAAGRLWWYRSDLFVAGITGGGYDIDPYETNTVVDYGGINFTLPAGGFLDIPMTASEFKEVGIHQLAAILSEAGETGRRSSLSDVLTIEYDPESQAGSIAFRLRCEPQALGAIIYLPQLKPLGNYYLHRSTDLDDLAEPSKRIATVTLAAIAAMTATERAEQVVEDTGAGGRAFYQLFFEAAEE